MASRLGVAQRVRKHRLALRAAGLRPVQISVPDTRRSGIAAECRHQCPALRKGRSEAGRLKWLEGVADTEIWKYGAETSSRSFYRVRMGSREPPWLFDPICSMRS